MSGMRDEFHASQMKKPIPTPPVSISAATIASHERPMPMRSPVKMYGAADGIMILTKNSRWLSRSTAATLR